MTLEDFIRRWRTKLAGLALYGAVSDQRDGPLAKAARVYEIPNQVEALLAAMYRDLQPKPTETTNGEATRAQTQKAGKADGPTTAGNRPA
jgi:hypothetical protein